MTPPSSTDPENLPPGQCSLSSGVEVKGSVTFQKALLIDGKVEGEISSDGVLTIGENADIRGEIKTKSVMVYGKVHGNITADRCELRSSCTLEGDVKAARFVIEEGATFIGSSQNNLVNAAKPSERARASDGSGSPPSQHGNLSAQEQSTLWR
jgi:cytoskeletal protein CcmA (bactofilin family)